MLTVYKTGLDVGKIIVYDCVRQVAMTTVYDSVLDSSVCKRSECGNGHCV